MTDRAVSSTLNYVLSLGIATLLVTGLLLAGGSFVEDRQQEVIRSELGVIGQQVASDLQRADRLVQAGNGGTDVTVEQSLPERITGTTYRMRLEDSPPKIRLTSTNPEVGVTVRLQSTTGLRESTAQGGTVVVTYDGGRLEVSNG